MGVGVQPQKLVLSHENEPGGGWTQLLVAPTTHLVSTADQLDAAALVLVVCGHRKGAFAEWLLGSVGDFAVHHSAVPVVVLHGSEFAPEVAP